MVEEIQLSKVLNSFLETSKANRKKGTKSRREMKHGMQAVNFLPENNGVSK
jgi:hypothetical protein